MESKFNELNELIDLTIIYQNNTFIESEEMPLGNLIGLNISELKDGLTEDRLNTYNRVLKERKRIDFNNIDIEGNKFNASLYPLADSQNIAIVFRLSKMKKDIKETND